MASLARSLLALVVVALLQVACAHAPVKVLGPIGYDKPGEWGGGARRHCGSHMFGKRSLRHDMQYDLAPIRLNKRVNDVIIHDPHRQKDIIGTIIVGEEISVCTAPGVRAKVTLTSNSFDNVRVVSNQKFGSTLMTMNMKLGLFWSAKRSACVLYVVFMWK
ncbi:hypothetical protein MSG28_001899 [Choristoneura fumiferana]|uniref:Uncharacterized protein n=1 Tax=Choristoneura fumiferana TaxID=7141 RepID=A0ACC0JTA2_CHOFU|nr:hypothetical protein MSG28_001899 [Choristoneura fumiferana]